MWDYVERLMKCGYPSYKAYCVCQDFIKNLSLIDLQCFIDSMEREYYVGRMESKSRRA